MGKRRPGKVGAARKKAAKKGSKKKAKKKTAPKKKAAHLSEEAAAAIEREALKRDLDKRLADTKPGYRPCPRPEPAVVPVSGLRVARTARDDVGDVSELADSIRKNGLLVPLVVSPDGEVLDGRRRLEALDRLDITEVPVVVVPSGTNGHVVEAVTNIMRKDLTPGERGRAYQVIMRVYHMPQVKLGEMIGVHPSAISRDIGRLSAPEDDELTTVNSDENGPESPEEGPPETIVDGRKTDEGVASGEAGEKATEKRQAERKAEGGKPRGAKRAWFNQDKALLTFALANVKSLRVSATQVEYTVLLDAPEAERIGPALFERPMAWRSAMSSQCRSLRGMVLAQDDGE